MTETLLGIMRRTHLPEYAYNKSRPKNKQPWMHGKKVFVEKLSVSHTVNPLNPEIKIHILLTVLHTFCMELIRRIS